MAVTMRLSSGTVFPTLRIPSPLSKVRVRFSRPAHWLMRLMWRTPGCKGTQWVTQSLVPLRLRAQPQLVLLKAHLQVIANRRTNG
ncbi:hypothetical protein HOU26_gp67 [Escherichia phage IMM-002]|uniref:Uncharacterized protein n=1 Tax=Escherichia phage IMM-002 TaxID=2041760 RepID=A0A384WIK8_9CAUD|nr:hypothetical protein HOU26_gp67 [Escherichia phage IMM-002]ATI17026.1 hypothetical protein [Escherichia phage IMM-002]